MSYCPPLAQRAPSDESVFLFDSDMSTIPGSMISDSEDTQSNFGWQGSIKENSQAPFQFTNFAPSNAIPVNNRMSLLSQHLKAQGNLQTYGSPIAIINQSSLPHSAGQAACSPMYHFMSSSLNINEQDQYMPLKFDDDLELLLLSPGPEVTSPTTDWPFDRSQAYSNSIGIPPTSKLHGRGGSLSNSLRPQHHPYRSANRSGGAEAIYSPGTSFIGHVSKSCLPHQQQAVLNIMGYQRVSPSTAIPASFITADLAEVQDGRGWCLLGNCGIDRAKQKLNRYYDPTKDTTRKRLDHLYDHIRDKHFNCRPFRCAMVSCTETFSREHDLKRHEKTHGVSLPCDVCGKGYTREDNLARHKLLKHMSVPQTGRGFSTTNFPY